MKAVQISRGGCIVRSDAGARPLQLGREREREREKVGEYFENWDHGDGEEERKAMGTRGVANLTTFNDVASAIRSLDV